RRAAAFGGGRARASRRSARSDRRGALARVGDDAAPLLAPRQLSPVSAFLSWRPGARQAIAGSAAPQPARAPRAAPRPCERAAPSPAPAPSPARRLEALRL